MINYSWEYLLSLVPEKLKSFTIESNYANYEFSCELQNGERFFTDFWELQDLLLSLEMGGIIK